MDAALAKMAAELQQLRQNGQSETCKLNGTSRDVEVKMPSRKRTFSTSRRAFTILIFLH